MGFAGASGGVNITLISSICICMCRLAESSEWGLLELAEVCTLISSDELAADEPFIIHSILR